MINDDIILLALGLSPCIFLYTGLMSCDENVIDIVLNAPRYACRLVTKYDVGKTAHRSIRRGHTLISQTLRVIAYYIIYNNNMLV